MIDSFGYITQTTTPTTTAQSAPINMTNTAPSSNMTRASVNNTSTVGGSSDCERGKSAGVVDADNDFNSHLGYNRNGHGGGNEVSGFLNCYEAAYDQEYARLQFGH